MYRLRGEWLEIFQYKEMLMSFTKLRSRIGLRGDSMPLTAWFCALQLDSI